MSKKIIGIRQVFACMTCDYHSSIYRSFSSKKTHNGHQQDNWCRGCNRITRHRKTFEAPKPETSYPLEGEVMEA